MLLGVNCPRRPTHLARSSVRRSTAAFAALGVLACAFVGATASAGPLPPLPDPNAPSPPPAAAPGPAAPQPAQAMSAVERTRRGIVTVERDNRILGVGTVINGDGRIVTSLAALGASDVADVRYADGSVVKAKVGHRDRAWDLALLVPQTGKWMDGLTPSAADPSNVELRTFIAQAPKHVAAVPLALKARSDVRAKDGDPLPGALELDLKGAPAGFPVPIGAPILDGNGNVVAVFVNACRAVAAATPAPPDYGAPAPGAAPAPCKPMIVGAPIPQVRRFLAGTPATAVQPPPWLGIRGEADSSRPFQGVRVLAVANESPAAKGGLKADLVDRTKSDLIITVDGTPVDSPERLGELIGRHSAGDTVKLLVWNGEKVREVAVQLRAAP